jgi:hypothetical protein
LQTGSKTQLTNHPFSPIDNSGHTNCADYVSYTDRRPQPKVPVFPNMPKFAELDTELHQPASLESELARSMIAIAKRHFSDDKAVAPKGIRFMLGVGSQL